MKDPCERCPFRKDVAPYLTLQRGIMLALSTRYREGIFHCHETVYGPNGGKRPKRLWQLCIGFATLRAQEAGNRFVKPHEKVYETMGAMILAYTKV